tara:strand:+ start:371 stop:793 length:423 start_codon:yes stop_codon:yes gene_type:complete
MENLEWRTKYLVRDLANKSIEDIEKEREAIHKKYEVEKEWNMREWSSVIPYLQFKPEWKVKITPPKLLGIIAFSIKYKNASVSVFLDGYNQIASVPTNDIGEPYWEMYPCKDNCDVDVFKMNDTKGLLKAIEQSIDAQNK